MQYLREDDVPHSNDEVQVARRQSFLPHDIGVHDLRRTQRKDDVRTQMPPDRRVGNLVVLESEKNVRRTCMSKIER